MQFLKIVFNIFRYSLLLVFIGLLIIHFIVKDRFQEFSVLFYGCPLPLIMILGIFVTLLFLKKKRIFYMLATVLLGISIYFFSHYFGTEFEKDTSKASSQILFWNAAQNQPLPTDILIKHIQQFQPEIVALVEALEVSEADINIMKKACPDYQFKQMQGEMLIAVKGSIDTIVFSPENEFEYCNYNYIKVTIQQKQISLIIADVQADPLLNKEIPLDIIHKACQKYQVDMLVGDFNTPYESVFFNKFKEDYISFHPYSIGMTSTWPTPIPVIELDQIWIKKSLQPIKLIKFCYKQSDHKLLIGEYQ